MAIIGGPAFERALRDAGTPEPGQMTDFDLGWLVADHSTRCACAWCREETRRREEREALIKGEQEKREDHGA